MKGDNREAISVGDVVLIEEDKVPRFCWRMALVERLIYENNDAPIVAVARVSKTHKELSRPVNKPYLLESIENKKKEMNDASETIETQNHPRRKASVIRDIR